MRIPRLLAFVPAPLALALALDVSAREPAPMPVQLVESVPVETRLGNPDLPRAQATWLEMIRGAKRTLDLEQFYVSTWPGEPLEPVLQAIGEAGRRGVKVRLLVDARMHRTYPQPADSLGTLPNIESRIIDIGRIAGGVQHAKYFIVDGEQVFVGSQNFDWRALAHIHELGVRIRDARVARDFGQVFDLDWAVAADTALGMRPVPQRPIETPLAIVQAPGDTVTLWPTWSPKRFIPDTTAWDRDAIVKRIDEARREVVVQLLTYSPNSRERVDDAIDQALRRAGARGVHVRLLISDWEADGSAIGALQKLSQAPGIEAKLGTVPPWSGGYIPFARVEHCKYMVVDSLWTWVGTANWEPGYFHGTRNLGVVMRNRPIALAARKIFEVSWTAEGAAPVRADARYQRKEHGLTPPAGMKVYGN